MNGGLLYITRTVRGIPLWLLREYLQELGGQVAPDGKVLSEGWSASLTQLEDFRLGSIRVGEVRIDLEATPGAWEQIQPDLEKKLMRAGG